MYRSTRLWKLSFADRADDPSNYTAPKQRLRGAWEKMRGRAEDLAREISQNFRNFTVHDISHLDALWEAADLVAGELVSLNPLEGFVFGAAVLIHDLGLALAAYPDGLNELRKTPVWKDSLLGIRRQRGSTGEPAEVKDATPEEVEAATANALRVLHAERAEKLAQLAFRHHGQEYYLLEDQELRYSFGPLIGRIAHSHWWGVPRLGVEFQRTVGAAHWCPAEWVVDPLTIAALLRLSDFAQIDARRAPGFRRAIRKPKGLSDLHWNFQQHLHKAQREGDRLVFTSSRPFEASEAQSWWLGFETIQQIDREVREVDALLADQGRKRFAVRNVAGAEDPQRMARLIATEGWIPIEARIQASNAKDIVRKLGGEELYGSHPSVTIRELVQNSCDAVRARRALWDAGPDLLGLRFDWLAGTGDVFHFPKIGEA